MLIKESSKLSIRLFLMNYLTINRILKNFNISDMKLKINKKYYVMEI